MKPQVLQTLLRNAMRDNPDGSEMEISNASWALAQKSPDAIRALFLYWFKNSYHDFVVSHIGPHSIAILSAKREVLRSVAKGTRTRNIIDMVSRMEAKLMDHLLSDGTALRFASFGQCQREGGWLLSIGKMGKANEVVGKKLTEKDLRNLLQRHAKVTPQKAAA